MRFSHLTPNQYAHLGAHIDTLWVSTFSTDPLGPAVPHATAQWIAEGLTAQTAQHFSGRVAAVELGSLQGCVPYGSDVFMRLEALALRPVRYAVLLTDRTLTSTRIEARSDSGARWLVLDWWQWLRRRVPDDRLQDAWMYLAYTHLNYAGSREQRELRQPTTVTAQMTREGQALLLRMAEWTVAEVQGLWRLKQADAEEERSNSSPPPISDAARGAQSP